MCIITKYYSIYIYNPVYFTLDPNTNTHEPQRVKTSQGKRVNIDDTLADANRRLADAVSFL